MSYCYYCYNCDKRLTVGFRSTCCDECEMCHKCMSALLNGTCPVELVAYVKKNYKIVGENIVIPGDEEIVNWLTEKQSAKCPICLKGIGENSFKEF